MKSELKLWLETIAMVVLALIVSTVIFLFLNPANASGNDHGDTQNVHTTYNIKKSNDGWQLPVAIIAIGAGVWCWYNCGDQPKDEPPPNPGPALKNDITPTNVKDKPRQFLIEAN